MYTEWDGSLRLLDLKTEEMMRLLELLSRRCKNWTDPTMKSWPSPLMTLVCSWRRWTGSGSKEDVWKKRWKMNQQIRKNVGPGMRTMCFWCATILTHCANQQFSENLSWDVGWQTAALLPRKPDWASERASPSPVATVGEKPVEAGYAADVNGPSRFVSKARLEGCLCVNSQQLIAASCIILLPSSFEFYHRQITYI